MSPRSFRWVRPGPATPRPRDGHWYGQLWHALDGDYFRRRLFEALGSDRYSMPALHELDTVLPRLLGRNGFFVEAGANDGFDQSNTYYLERRFGWRGVLIEAIPTLARRCAFARPRARVVQAAVVPPERSGSMIPMRYGHLMSLVAGARGSEKEDEAHLANAQAWTGVRETYKVLVPGLTLSEILEEVRAPRDIGFLSLDLEGYELEALRGLDLDQHSPRFILCEIRDPESTPEGLRSLLGTHYDTLAWLTPNDLMLIRRDVPKYTLSSV